MKFDDEQREDGKYLTGKLIMPDQVREETGTYWGYSLRLAKSLGKIFEDVRQATVFSDLLLTSHCI